MSLVFVLVSVVTLQYDQALMLPKNTEEGAVLFWTSLLSVCLLSGISLLCCIIFCKQILSIFQVKELSGWIFFVPMSIFLQGVYATLTSWSTRQKKFIRTSVSQVARSASMSGVQLASGILKTGPGGLVGGSMTGDLTATLVLGWQIRHAEWQILIRSLSWKKVECAAKQYRDFSFFSSASSFLNAISMNIPIFLLAKFFGPAVAGFYAVAVRVIQAPMNFVLTSLRQVFFQKASELYHQGGDTYALFKKTTVGLLAIGVIPAMLIAAFGPKIFAFVLGDKWFVAGVYARWLILWLLFVFANVPAFLFSQIYRKQKSLLIQNIVLLFFRILAITVGGLRSSPLLAIALYGMVGIFFNLFLILWAGNFMWKEKREKG